jgi:hypothetical protein
MAVWSFSLLLASCTSVDNAENAVPEFEVSSIASLPPESGTFLNDGNFLTDWNILGPFRAPEKPAAFHEEQIAGESTLNGLRRAPKGTRWHVLRFSNDAEDAIPGLIDFSGRISGKCVSPSIFYACATLKADSEMRDLSLRIGSCGKVKVWINGVTVYAYEGKRRMFRLDEDSVGGITLKKGMNRIVLKYMDNDGEYDRERKFSFRFSDEQGRPVQIK